LWPFAGPGGWNDPCLLLGRDNGGKEAVTDQQGRAQFTMWAIMASPLLLSQNVRNLTQFQLDTYLNKEVIAVSQDPMGRQGQKLFGGDLSDGSTGTRMNIWGRPLQDGSWAIAFINANPTTAMTAVCAGTCLNATGWDSSQVLIVRDLWKKMDLPRTTVKNGVGVSGLVKNGGVALFRITPVWR